LDLLESGSRPRGGVRGIQDGVPSVGGEHLDAVGGFDFEAIKYVPESFFSRMKRGHIRQSDILVVKDGATTGKVSLVRHDFPFARAVVNEHVFVCRPNDSTLPEFLFWFLWSRIGQDALLENFQGSAQGGINQGFADNVMTPVAPLTEQRRIAAKVEALLARVSVARERLERVPRILKRFRQAVLAAACEGRLTEGGLGSIVDSVAPAEGIASQPTHEPPAPWPHRSLAELCDLSRPITYGVIKLGPDTGGGVPTLRSSNVRPLALDLRVVKPIATEIADAYPRTKLRGGEVLVTVRGTLGGVAVVPNELRGYNVSREVAVAAVQSPAIPAFVALCVASPTSVAWLAEREKGAAYTGINIEDLRELPIPVPSPEEQEEVVSLANRLFALADTIEHRVNAALARTEKLPQAILSRAFAGELVPTEAELARAEARSYETAAELLERIRTERARAKTVQAARKAKVPGRKRPRTMKGRARH